MRFLNSKERRDFFNALEETYGYSGSRDFVIFEGGKDKYYVISRDIEKIPFEEIRIAQGGLYVAAPMGDSLRLTMDGAMLLGPDCDKPFAEFSLGQRDLWMAGKDVPYEADDGLLIVSWNGHILGCGYAKDGVIQNMVPKGRRIHEPHETGQI